MLLLVIVRIGKVFNVSIELHVSKFLASNESTSTDVY